MRFFKKRNVFSKIKNVRKSTIALLLSTNLLIVSTGSAQLNIATDSANLERQATSSATFSPTPIATPTFTPTPTILPSVEDVLVPKNLPISTKVDPTGDFFEDELILAFKENTSDDIQRGILVEDKLIIKRDFKKAKVKLIQVDPAKRDQVLSKLTNNPNIKYAHLSYVGKAREGTGYYSPNPSCTPNDPFYCQGLQWQLKDEILAPWGWARSKGSSSIAVAVLDTGINWGLSDLGLSLPTPGGTSNGRVVRGIDVTQPDGFFNTSMDHDGHGTQVAGIIGALTNNNHVIAGVDWYAKLVAIKIMGPGGQMYNPAILAEGIMEAIDPSGLNHYPDYRPYQPPKAKIINISAGLMHDVPEVKEAVDQALAAGVVIVAAAENGPRDCFMGFPAAYPGVISVGALANRETVYNTCIGYEKEGKVYQPIQIGAPGVNIWTLDLAGAFSVSGTSFAAPFVSGVASVVASCVPNGDAAKIKKALLDSASGYGKMVTLGAVYFGCP